MIDLQDRPNPSRWSDLLARTLPLLDHVFGPADGSGGPPAWTMGGGTALALRIAHRISDDIDIFVGAADLREFTPARNPHARAMAGGMQFPGSYLRFGVDEGEIDFLPGPLLTVPGYTWETFRGRRIALQTCEEVVVKKVRYRAASFKARDAFDLAAVASLSSELGALLIGETGDRLSILQTALSRQDAWSMAGANIRPLPGYEDHVQTSIARMKTLVASLVAGMETS